MPRSGYLHESWGRGLHDGCDDLREIVSDEDDGSTIPCLCGRELSDDSAEHEPECGRSVSAEDQPTPWKPWRIVEGVVASLGVVNRWVSFP